MEGRSRFSRALVRPLTFDAHRSNSPTWHVNSPPSSSAFNFAVRQTLSPTRASFNGAPSYCSASTASSSSINLGLDRSASQVRTACLAISTNFSSAMKYLPFPSPRKKCMCLPKNHPGLFRCSLHKKGNNSSLSNMHSQLNVKRSAMKNSLVRIDGVEGEWVRRALTTLICPSSHHMRRITSFQPRSSRIYHMTKAQDGS